MSATKKIGLGVIVCTLGWTLQHFYMSRVLSASGRGLKPEALDQRLAAEIAKETEAEQVVIALERAQGDDADWEEIEEAEEDIRETRQDLLSDDDTIEERIDAEIDAQEGEYRAIKGVQKALITTAIGVLLKVIGMFLIVTGCLEVIGATQAALPRRRGAMIIVLLGSYVMLTDHLAVPDGMTMIPGVVGIGVPNFLMYQNVRSDRAPMDRPSTRATKGSKSGDRGRLKGSQAVPYGGDRLDTGTPW